MAMRIEAVTHLTAEIHEALGRLLPQLNAKLGVPDADRMRRMLDDPDVVLLIARDGERIVGTTTVVVYTTPYFPNNRMPGDTPFYVAASLAYHGAWLAYLFRSRRVRNTY